MPKEDRQQQKRPSGSRPLARRLFSTDSSRSAAESGQVHSRSISGGRGPTAPLKEDLVTSPDPFADALVPPTPPREAWTVHDRHASRGGVLTILRDPPRRYDSRVV